MLRTCVDVKPGERVLIVTDTRTESAVAWTLLDAAIRLRAQAATITMEARARPGDEPPDHVAAAMRASDVIIAPTSTTLFYSDATRSACQKGSRFIAMTGANYSVLTSRAMYADFQKQEKTVKKIARLLTQAEDVRLTNPAGTNLELSVKGRKAVSNSGLCRKAGEVQGVPDIEVYIAPVEGSTNGTLIIDGSTSVTGIAKKPLSVVIERGTAIKISGGPQADQLQAVLQKARSKAAFRVGELGIGLNPLAHIHGAIIEDEAVLGTAHIALGDNRRFGGNNLAPIHVDLVLRRPRIELDGKLILDGKRIIA